MGGEGYALTRALLLSDAALAQLRSRENRARSESVFPRRSPSEIFEESKREVIDCMEVAVANFLPLITFGIKTDYEVHPN